MTFEEALKQMKVGVKIRRAEWQKGVYYFLKKDAGVYIYATGQNHKVRIIPSAELLMNDWEIVL